MNSAVAEFVATLKTNPTSSEATAKAHGMLKDSQWEVIPAMISPLHLLSGYCLSVWERHFSSLMRKFYPEWYLQDVKAGWTLYAAGVKPEGLPCSDFA